MSRAWLRTVRHGLRLQWRQSLAWTLVFAASALAVVSGYTSVYTTPAARALVAEQIGGNPAFQALNGEARALDTVGGFTAWRVGGPLVVLAAAWGLLAATKLLRGEEESGHTELLLAGRIGRAGALSAGLASLGIVFAVAWVVTGAALALAGAPARGSFVVAFAIVLGGIVFGLAGGFASQLFESRRRAAGWTGAALGLSFLLRVGADGSETLGWLRWATPLGWIENLHPFTGTDLEALLPVAVLVPILLAGTFALRSRRDLGSGVVAAAETGRRRTRLLGSATGLAVLSGRWTAAAWALAAGTFAFVFGLLAGGIVEFAREEAGLGRLVRQLGGVDLTEPEGFLGLAYSAMVVLAVAIYLATQAASAREEEASGRLDNLLVRRVGRAGWLGTRALVAVGGAVVVALAAGILAWIGTVLEGSRASLGGQLVGALNCLPAGILFLGLGVLVLGFVPRLTGPVTVGAVIVAYLVQLVGGLLDWPDWALDLSPFHHVAPAPAVPVDGASAAAMMAIGVVAGLLGMARFARRDVALA